MTTALATAALAGAAAGQVAVPGGLEELRAQEPTLEEILRAFYSDSMVAVVGEDLVTDQEVTNYVRQGNLEEDPADLYPDASDQEIRALRYEAALRAIIDERLKTIGGRNLGFDAELVQRAVEGQVESFIEGRGGAQLAAQAMQRMGITRDELRRIYERRMLGTSWEATVTGRGPGGTGRFVVDNFVRPGQRHARYQELLRVNVRAPGAREAREEVERVVGKTPGQVTLRQFPVVPRGADDLERARETLEALRTNILAGVLDFEEMLLQVAPPDFRGEQGYVRGIAAVDLPRLLALQHPESAEALAGFLEDPEPGDLTPVLPMVRGGRVVAFTIYRVESYQPATEAQPFTDRGVQRRLVKLIQEERSDVAVRRGLARLARSTYVAPPLVQDWLLQRGRVEARRPGDGAPGDGGGAPDGEAPEAR